MTVRINWGTIIRSLFAIGLCIYGFYIIHADNYDPKFCMGILLVSVSNVILNLNKK